MMACKALSRILLVLGTDRRKAVLFLGLCNTMCQKSTGHKYPPPFLLFKYLVVFLELQICISQILILVKNNNNEKTRFR